MLDVQEGGLGEGHFVGGTHVAVYLFTSSVGRKLRKRGPRGKAGTLKEESGGENSGREPCACPMLLGGGFLITKSRRCGGRWVSQFSLQR